MPTWIALLRGINVGGSGVLPMKDLAALCSGLGFSSVRTYIQSGNVVFESPLPESAIRSTVEKALTERMGRQVEVMVRTPAELRAILKNNPFPGRAPNKTAIVFLTGDPPRDLLQRTIAPGGEEVHPGRREIYIYYPDGMGRSRLKLPLNGAAATVRNLNTVAKLAALAETRR